MVIAGRSVHLTTLFPGQACTSGWPVIRAQTFACNWQQPFLNKSAEERRMTVEIISWSISTKVWDRTGIKLATPGSAVRNASVARHVTDCATWPGIQFYGVLEGDIYRPDQGWDCQLEFRWLFSWSLCNMRKILVKSPGKIWLSIR